MRTMMFVVTNLPSGHSVLLVDQDLRAGLATYSMTHGSGTQAPSIWPAPKAARPSAFACGLIETSPPPSTCGGQALLLQPVAQGDVLGVAELRRGEGLALEVGRVGDLRRTTRAAPPDAAPAMTLTASPLDCA